MRRIVTVLLAAALVLLTLQTPAAAKGPDFATIAGPGIGTMRLTWENSGNSVHVIMRITRFWDGSGVAAWTFEPPAGDLGPRFDLTYDVPAHPRPSSGNATLIRQELYPYAAAGPVVYMPEGQTMYGIDMPYGWLATDHRLTRVVERLGGTSRPVQSSAAGPSADPAVTPAAHQTPASSDGPAWDLIAAGVLGLGLVAAVAAAGWRRLRAVQER